MPRGIDAQPLAVELDTQLCADERDGVANLRVTGSAFVSDRAPIFDLTHIPKSGIVRAPSSHVRCLVHRETSFGHEELAREDFGSPRPLGR